tara:strand:+ start:1158 stop:1355 length:198 start_codon:yes stop_codon:yes gene_type:complete
MNIINDNIKDKKLKQKIINLMAIEKIKYSLNNFKKCYTQHQPKSIQKYFSNELERIDEELNKIKI